MPPGNYLNLDALMPSDACTLLNSTPLGEVLTDRKLRSHRTAAGFRVGDGKKVNLFKYAAWLASQRHGRETEAGPSTTEEGLGGYEAYKEVQRARRAALSRSGRNIGEMPPIKDPDRRARCARNFRLFCEEYFPFTFTLSWSQDHLTVISKLQTSILEGGLFAMAMPRGSGKTTLVEVGCMWASLYGHRNFTAVIGSDEAHAASMLESIKSEIENNELLMDDFPEVCYPVKCLDGINQRAAGQLYEGESTNIDWSAKEVVFPTIPGSVASGAIIAVAGITGRIRGMKRKRSDGVSVRPSLVLVDDPQTDEAARSPSQCASREAVLAGAILGLAGPGKKIAGLMTLTVIRLGDMADRLLDRDKHPAWQGERTKMMYAFPSNEDLWIQYAELRSSGLKNGRGIVEATEFYQQSREAMDAGAHAAWEQRFNHDELSAVQHAMNLKFQNEEAFWAEYQNEPLPENDDSEELMNADKIAAKTSGIERAIVPVECSHLTMFIDVQGKLLYWLVAGWHDDFTGYVLDYGTFPRQSERYFKLRDARVTLQDAFPSAGLEGAIYAGLEQLIAEKVGRPWMREDNTEMRIERCLIDANWGQSTDVVYQFCRATGYGAVVMPSHGKYVGASSKPMGEYAVKRGERVGPGWRIPIPSNKRVVRHALYDTNHWKTFVQQRLSTSMGDPGCLSLFGRAAEAHRLIADHITSEYRIQTEGRGRKVDEWKLRLESADNHWLDCLTGAAVAASIQGVSLMGESVRPTKKTKYSMAERIAQARDGRGRR